MMAAILGGVKVYPQLRRINFQVFHNGIEYPQYIGFKELREVYGVSDNELEGFEKNSDAILKTIVKIIEKSVVPEAGNSDPKNSKAL